MDTAANSTAAAVGNLSSLVERIRAGDSSAEAELYNAYHRGVFLMLLFGLVIAKPLATWPRVFIAVLKAVREGQLRESDKLPAFIQGTARNIINNFLRARARRASAILRR